MSKKAIWRIEQWFIKAREEYQDRIKPTTPIGELGITRRCLHPLKRAGIHTVEDLFNYGPERLSELRDFGVKSALDLIENGLKPQAENNDWERRALEAEHVGEKLKSKLSEAVYYLEGYPCFCSVSHECAKCRIAQSLREGLE